MKSIFSTLTCMALAVGVLSGCANMSETERGTAQGAGIGAVAGTLLGAVIGGSKGAATGAVLGGAAGAVGGNVWSTKMQNQKIAMERATAGTGVAVSQTSDNRLKLDIPSDVSFDVGRADLKPNFGPVLNQFATSLNTNPGTIVNIIGHTDNTGTDAINNPLSVQRANATRDYLVSRGVATTRMGTDGRGSREPVADNNNASGRDKNRRVEIYVTEQVAAR